MNNKRQTIWLVSMLSLMVILSAYYLFTEDAPTNNITGTEASQMEDEGKVSSQNPEGVIVTEVDPTTDELTGVQPDSSANEAASDSPEGTGGDSKGISPEDEAVISGIDNYKGNQLLDQKLIEQRNSISKKAEDLRAAIGNTKLSQEEGVAAAEELSRLEETDLRITSLQEKLLQDFDNAVVEEEDTNFKVIVLSDKLEKKQAINIMDLATKELEVTPDRITVQYVQ